LILDQGAMPEIADDIEVVSGPEAVGPQVAIFAAVTSKVTFASHQNSVPIIRDLRLENLGEESLENLVLKLTAEPLSCRRSPERRPLVRLAEGPKGASA
jgi:hypothetical protein